MWRILLLVLIPGLSYGDTFEECLDDMVNLSQAIKAKSAMIQQQGRDCSALDVQNWTDLSENLSAKKKMRLKLLLEFKRKGDIPSVPFADFDQSSLPSRLNQLDLCNLSRSQAREYVGKLYEDEIPGGNLKSCHGAIVAFKETLRKQQLLFQPLYEGCSSVLLAEAELKKEVAKCNIPYNPVRTPAGAENSGTLKLRAINRSGNVIKTLGQ
jgi:hypothetical protein